MRCSAYCIGNSLDLIQLQKILKFDKRHTNYKNDFIHQQFPHQGQHVFYFKNGTVVTWNFTRKQSRQIALDVLRLAEPLDINMVEEHYSYLYGDKTIMKNHGYFNVEHIYLADEDPETKLAISYGLSQSIKLYMYQKIISNMTDRYSPLVNQLAETGKIHLGRNETKRIIGKIFWVKGLINLKSEYLTLPGYFWLHTNLESMYLMVERYMDIPKRLAMMNQKLDVLNEIFNILSSELHHQYATILEWIIIVLLVVEVTFSILGMLK